MVALDIGTKTFDLPENWQEILTMGRWEAYVQAMMDTRVEAQRKWNVLRALSGMDGYTVGAALGAATAEQRGNLAAAVDDAVGDVLLSEALPVLDFIWSNHPDVRQYCEENPLPVIVHKGVTYYGPSARLDNQCGSELEQSEWAYITYLSSGNEQQLLTLVAALYRPAKKKPDARMDPRELYTEAGTAAREKLFEDLPAWQVAGVLLWYEEMTQLYAHQHANLFGKGGNKTAPDPLSFSKIIRGLAGDKRGTVAEVRAQMTRGEIFFEMQQLEEEAQRMRAAMKK